MRTSWKALVGLTLGLMLLVAAPLVYADKGGDRGGKAERGGGCGERSGHGGGKGDLDVVGVTADSRLICFQDDRPGSARDVGTVAGLTGDSRLVGIDYRPATGNDGSRGVLYGLGNAGGIYTIDDRTGQATKLSQLSVALTGTSFGVDFNPTVDRLRIVGDDGQNLRVNVDTGAATVDGTLTYPGPPPATATGVTGAAYTNNDNDPSTATTLFDLDSTLDQTVIQSPANSGQLAATGKLGADTSSAIGSDIYSTIRNGTTVGLRGLASLTVGGSSGLYRIDLLSGRAQSQGGFAARNQVTGIAIPLNQL